MDNEYKLGIAEIDAQHEHWIYLMEAFKNAITDHLLEPVSIEASKKLLSELLDYTKNHFEQEERLMLKYNELVSLI